MIRNAELKDVSRIAEILVFGKRVAYRDIFQDDFGSFHELQVYDIIKEYLDKPSLMKNILVYDDGIIKGIVNRKFNVMTESADEIELCEFYVEPFFKGQGIGQALIQYLIQEAREAQKTKIFLWVIKDNLSARRFYERNGFAADGQERIIEGTSVMDIRYVRELL
ncbi:MAG: GNAT family N-acetyltransferase [Lachnospiraceae bacterium]|nr:GNAT family N-acetyltransferase [Lachnospiraceae bacterium]